MDEKKAGHGPVGEPKVEQHQSCNPKSFTLPNPGAGHHQPLQPRAEGPGRPHRPLLLLPGALTLSALQTAQSIEDSEVIIVINMQCTNICYYSALSSALINCANKCRIIVKCLLHFLLAFFNKMAFIWGVRWKKLKQCSHFLV